MGVAPGAVDAHEGLVVVVLVPVEGGDPRKGPLAVAAHQARGGRHQAPEGQGPVPEQRRHRPDQVPGAVPVPQLERGGAWGG